MKLTPETRLYIVVEVFAGGKGWPGAVEHWRERDGRRQAWVRYTTGVGKSRLEMVRHRCTAGCLSGSRRRLSSGIGPRRRLARALFARLGSSLRAFFTIRGRTFDTFANVGRYSSIRSALIQRRVLSGATPSQS